MSKVKRLYVEKKSPYAVMAGKLFGQIEDFLGLQNVESVRILIRYDIENVSDEVFEKAKNSVFCEPNVDYLYEEKFDYDGKIFSTEYLPGQFDQRADSAMQCVKLLDENEDPVIKTATTYVIKGDVSDEQLEKIKSLCLNPVDSRECGEEKPETLITVYDEPEDIKYLEGFNDKSEEELRKLYESLSLAMTYNDFEYIRDCFKTVEKRVPTITEIKVLDTYWSDHCRHTTFSTEIIDVFFGEGDYKKLLVEAFNNYMKDRDEIYKDTDGKFICLMEMALLAAKKLKKENILTDVEESDEINACSIVVPVKVDGEEEEWLISFKNETHNHPTEIEPFGGAATCLGGAIRDPLSGRAYVYQAMRITGAADPTLPMEKTLEGKLPQKKIVQDAAHGYSSYGNQIGLATGYVKEIYHPGYVAKRMEIGAVMGASRRKNVMRLTSDPGDIIVLLGGRTGRDGIGGATGSSKVHTTSSIETCGAEVQKGNAPTERKLQRLFRRSEVSRIIKKCNDFGAGGVSVAIGELADGLEIDLDKVPKKYAGLDGTELAVSESQERMAVVIAPENVDEFMKYAAQENLEATIVAKVTQSPRLVMKWRGKEIVNLSRRFLDTNGVHQETEIFVDIPSRKDSIFYNGKKEITKEYFLNAVSDLNECSQKGLVEMFDASIGAASVTMPYGGKYQLTPTLAMVAKLPIDKGESDTVTMMSYGFDPYISSWSPYHGAIYAVTDSIAKIVATGGDYRKIHFSFQEYFRSMTGDPERWSQPFTALLGAYDAQIGFGLGAIGGKDSMSGTFNDIDVPPTLVSFAVDVADKNNVVTPELKGVGHKLMLFTFKKNEFDVPVYEDAKKMYSEFFELVKKKVIKASYVPDRNGITPAVFDMAIGNKIGVKFDEDIDESLFYSPLNGSIIAEIEEEGINELNIPFIEIGETIEKPALIYNNIEIALEEAISSWKKPLEKIFPSISHKAEDKKIDIPVFETKDIYICKNKVAKPKVFIPVFPGTNCEYDSAKAFENAGAEVSINVFKNLSAKDIRDSVEAFSKGIKEAQIVMFPGGFSAGDEPEGSAKFFATAFRNEKIKEAIEGLINERDGLVLGICNGFQALIKLGLVPFGKIVPQSADAPTLTYNTVGRHISKMAYLKVVSNKSPWLKNATNGGVYVNPVSHGEGRFVANDEWLKKLVENGQVATVYSDQTGNVSMDEEYNVNGSYLSIEGITSPDGRIYGKMAHSERRGDSVAVNIEGNQNLELFKSGVEYFR
ncbi:phosphoribosylformylglycinamidine synthase [Acetitomaculum ruminis DSM 5522]|uniref:Phosphoribosylformylglycinamidine synthase n=1 Tax=Acetitomaculum ruminis DSM 5522 TaxID=1120918 RepID=A0A1I0WIW3_9FIRM|nr:phosphoribosylformylglycinamidine synthase [Acetitomaculum ruminis]SFA88327.1 phosphoribosylformylglycinamidine synthase [Acetitomaculum ruminis DSM 5522]